MIWARLFCVALVFPFTKLVSIEAYNQPYGLLLATLILLVRPSTLNTLPQADRWTLNSLLVLGTGAFVLQMTQGLNLREILYWISYLSPFLMVPVMFWVVSHHTQMVRQTLTWGIYVWVGVGVIQLTINPTFLNFLVTSSESLSLDILSSGRGVLSMAPEPTHHGFQLLILATSLALLGGSRVAIILALLAAVFIARSSSVVMALALGGMLWLLLRPIRRAPMIIAALISITLVGALSQFLDDSLRITRLLAVLLETRGEIIFYDRSVNMRIAGMILPWDHMLRSGFWPAGLSLEAWQDIRMDILTKYPWVLDLSENGPASGFGLILMQLGFFAIPILIVFFKRLAWDLRQNLAGLLTCAIVFVFLGQLYLATPSFSLVYGIALWKIAQTRQARRQRAALMASTLGRRANPV